MGALSIAIDRCGVSVRKVGRGRHSGAAADAVVANAHVANSPSQFTHGRADGTPHSRRGHETAMPGSLKIQLTELVE
jgi:hypothetical protein